MRTAARTKVGVSSSSVTARLSEPSHHDEPIDRLRQVSRGSMPTVEKEFIDVLKKISIAIVSFRVIHCQFCDGLNAVNQVFCLFRGLRWAQRVCRAGNYHSLQDSDLGIDLRAALGGADFA